MGSNAGSAVTVGREMTRYDAVVVGAGFAGLSAAVRLALRGVRVVVLESRRQLGGRATSYRDRVTGDVVDNGQHVIFGCYRETRRFLRTIGVEGDLHLQASLGVTYVDADSGTIRFRCASLPPPLHLIGGVMEWDVLSVSERLGALRLVQPLRRAQQELTRGTAAETAHPGETVREWLTRHGQGERLCRLLWEPLALAALNQTVDQAEARWFVRVLAELSGSDPADSAVGIPSLPLEEFYAIPARRFIESRGGSVRTGASGRVAFSEGRLHGVEAGHQLFAAPVTIAAVPWHALPRLFDPPPPSLARLLRQTVDTNASPIVTAHLWFETPVMDQPFIGLLGRTVQWVFAPKNASEKGGAHLTLVVSGAVDVVSGSNDAIIERAVSDVRAALPAARDVPLRHALVIRERYATFSLAPGQPERPSTETVIRGLFLAGDWIETGLPSTIESAVVSGHRAAEAALHELSVGRAS